MTTADDGPPTVVVVDVCGTLFWSDTTLGLLQHHFLRVGSRLKALLVRGVVERRSPLRLSLVVCEKLTGRHLAKHMLVKLLKGTEMQALEASGRAYADWLLSNDKIEQVWVELNSRANMTEIVLASASVSPVINAVAERLGVRSVSSSLESVNGVLTGRFDVDLTGKKLAALQQLLGSSVVDCCSLAISDNFSDAELLSQSKDALVVLHSQQHRARWSLNGAHYLGVYS